MTGVIDSLERAQLRRVPPFQAGDRLKVHFQVVEGTRRRTQVFEGVVLKRQGSGARETFTVRKQSFGVGVERTFPLHSPKIERIEIASRGHVRRAKLYYLRGRVGRRARVRERQYSGTEADALAAEAMQGPLDEQGSQEEAVAGDETADAAAPDAVPGAAEPEPEAAEAPAEDREPESEAAEGPVADRDPEPEVAEAPAEDGEPDADAPEASEEGGQEPEPTEGEGPEPEPEGVADPGAAEAEGPEGDAAADPDDAAPRA